MSLLLSMALAGDLESAYQKEYAFLDAERKTLTERLEAVQEDGEARISEKERELDALQGKLVRTTLNADDAEKRLDDTQRQTWSNEEDVDRIDALFAQAQDVGLVVPETEDEGDKLRSVFAQAADGLREGGSVRVEEGRFFDLSGAEQTGQLVKVGNVATWGVAGSTGGPLAPAGDGNLKLWEQDDRVSAVVGGQAPESLGIFLYEDLSKPVQERQEKTVADIMDGGGVVGWIIAGLGVAALLLSLVRLLILGGARKAAGRVKKTIEDAAGMPRPALEDIASEAVLKEIPRLERFGSAILVIAAVAPLLGLLGTVTGMIATFDIITEFGTGDPKMLSGGISTALITTQLGLIVAIPAVLLGNAMASRTDKVVGELETQALSAINRVAPAAAGALGHDGLPALPAVGGVVAHAK